MSASIPSAQSAMPSGAWTPFKHRVFVIMWTAMLLGNIGTWMRDVGAGWLMASMSSSATMVALVQVAGTLPLFLLSLPAGALADLVDRRKLLIAMNVLLAVVALTLGVLTQLSLITPQLLLAILLIGGIGSALSIPAMQSLTPMQVPRSELRSAIALNSMGFNVSRAIGPALGGLIIASLSISIAFYVDALSYLVVIAALIWWKAASTPASDETPEPFGGAMRTGIRYVMHAPGLKRILLRAASFFIFASAYWALLPTIARTTLNGSASFYGILLAAIGVGAVFGAIMLPAIRKRISAEHTLRLGIALTIGALLAIALVPNQVLAVIVLAIAGMAWIATLTTANTAAQTALPDWVRGRGLAIYLTAFYGAMTLGSIIWGQIADHFNVETALIVAAATGVFALILAFRLPMPEGEHDVTPSMHWPEPALTSGAATPDRAVVAHEVMVTIEYRIAQSQRDGFLSALNAVAEERQRNGATFWLVFEDTGSEAGHFIEVFLEPSWEEHLRHHHRVTKHEADLQANLIQYHIGAAPPVVKHWKAP
jgi:MFS family permease